jgi:hypothetical protein
MDEQTKQRELELLRERITELESELGVAEQREPWRTQGYYAAYHTLSGFLLGGVAALVSLLCNIAGSYAWRALGSPEQHPLRLIQVYLTFPMGEKALSMSNGLTLAIGCYLYIGTGMLYGMLFQVFFSRIMPAAHVLKRVLVGCLLGIAIWIVNFHLILDWLQPALLGGRWIVELIPPWVAMLTHVVFGVTMALLYPWGAFTPYVKVTDQPLSS